MDLLSGLEKVCLHASVHVNKEISNKVFASCKHMTLYGMWFIYESLKYCLMRCGKAGIFLVIELHNKLSNFIFCLH